MNRFEDAAKNLSVLYRFVIGKIADFSVETGIDADVLLKSFSDTLSEDFAFEHLMLAVEETKKDSTNAIF